MLASNKACSLKLKNYSQHTDVPGEGPPHASLMNMDLITDNGRSAFIKNTT